MSENDDEVERELLRAADFHEVRPGVWSRDGVEWTRSEALERARWEHSQEGGES